MEIPRIKATMRCTSNRDKQKLHLDPLELGPLYRLKPEKFPVFEPYQKICRYRKIFWGFERATTNFELDTVNFKPLLLYQRIFLILSIYCHLTKASVSSV